MEIFEMKLVQNILDFEKNNLHNVSISPLNRFSWLHTGEIKYRH